MSIISKIKDLLKEKTNKDQDKEYFENLYKENYHLNIENEVYAKDISKLNDLLSMQGDFIVMVIEKAKRTLKDATTNKDEEAYNKLKRFDKEGYTSYYTAKSILNIDIYDKFLQEDCVGTFEFCDGYELLKWLEIAAFGKHFTYKRVGHYELIDNYEIDYQSEEYKNYKKIFYNTVIDKIIESIYISDTEEIIKDGLFI